MENAVDALKIAFAVIVFSMALSLTVYMFSEARETADAVLHSSDITEFIQYEEADYDGDTRLVGLETIVPTLYKYYKENYTVVFRNSTGYMTLYETNMTLPTEYLTKYNSSSSNFIYSFDVDEETKRNEPWTGSREEYKKNIDKFLSGGVYKYPSSATATGYDEYNYPGFIDLYKDAKFIETLGEYAYNSDTADNAIEMKKRVIIYTLDS